MAVYTKLTDEDIKEFLKNYDIGAPEAYAPIEKGIENTNYQIIAGGKKYILTLFENRVENSDLPFFLRLTSHLQGKGISCPGAIPARNGEQLGELKGKKAAIITFLEGYEVPNIQLDHLAKLGEQVAKLHLAASDFNESRTNKFGLSKWVELFKKVGEKADTIKPGLTKFIAEQLEFLAANWPFNLPAGVVHLDLFPDNVFFKKGEISGVIDFYFSATDYYAYDLAICINAWNMERNPITIAMFLEEYNKIRPLSDAELNAMPVLLKGAAMRFFMTRLYDWFNTPEGAFVRKKSPLEYLEKLEYLVENLY